MTDLHDELAALIEAAHMAATALKDDDSITDEDIFQLYSNVETHRKKLGDFVLANWPAILAALKSTDEAVKAEREAVVVWLSAEAAQCREAAETCSNDMQAFHALRSLYYDQASGLIERGEHLKKDLTND